MLGTGVALGSSFNDLISGGASGWMKIVGDAIATPLAVVVLVLHSTFDTTWQHRLSR
jgi:hypothetical protein